jgi:hypothetical protein
LKKQTLKNKNTTTPIYEPFQLLLNVGRGLQGVGKEKEVNFDLFPTLAPLIDERCSYLSMLDFKILWELDYKDSPKLEKY